MFIVLLWNDDQHLDYYDFSLPDEAHTFVDEKEAEKFAQSKDATALTYTMAAN